MTIAQKVIPMDETKFEKFRDHSPSPQQNIQTSVSLIAPNYIRNASLLIILIILFVIPAIFQSI